MLIQTEVPVSLDLVAHGVEFGIILPVVGFMMKAAWADMKRLLNDMRNDMCELSRDFDKFRVEMTDRVARIEEHQPPKR